MKKVILVFIAASLLLTGCSDDGKKKTESTQETSSSAEAISIAESISSETVQATSGTTAVGSASDSSQKSDKNAQENQANTPVSDGELPIIGGVENSDEKPSVTDSPSSVDNHQTTTTVSGKLPSSVENNQTTTAKNSGGAVELPIIPVN